MGVITNCDINSWCNLKEYHKEEAIVVACGLGLSGCIFLCSLENVIHFSEGISSVDKG